MENENIVKETALSVAKETAKDVYADTVQPTAKNVGGFFGTLSGFFNHVVMYPLKKLNIRYEQKAIAFEKEMEHKYNSIPEKERVEPQLHIVGPTMESLKYNIMDDDLAELFSNLLVSDMDMRTQNLCTPAYTDMMSRSHLIIIIGLAYNPVLYERVTAACKNRAAPGAAMTGKGHNGTPVQPQPCLRSE